jgi:hypothetical protein
MTPTGPAPSSILFCEVEMIEPCELLCYGLRFHKKKLQKKFNEKKLKKIYNFLGYWYSATACMSPHFMQEIKKTRSIVFYISNYGRYHILCFRLAFSPTQNLGFM